MRVEGAPQEGGDLLFDVVLREDVVDLVAQQRGVAAFLSSPSIT